MTYDIARWDGKTYKVDLPEGTTEIAGVIVSGDEILVWPTYCDPWGGRGWRTSTKEGGARPSRMADGWKNERPRMSSPGFFLCFSIK